MRARRSFSGMDRKRRLKVCEMNPSCFVCALVRGRCNVARVSCVLYVARGARHWDIHIGAVAALCTHGRCWCTSASVNRTISESPRVHIYGMKTSDGLRVAVSLATHLGPRSQTRSRAVVGQSAGSRQRCQATAPRSALRASLGRSLLDPMRATPTPRTVEAMSAAGGCTARTKVCGDQ